MSRNNDAAQIEGGIILIKNLQCIIVSEKVEKSFTDYIKTKFLLKDAEKIQLELKFNNVNKVTTPTSVTSTTDNTKKKVAWDEHIHFNIGSSLNSFSSRLNITCWNTSIRGFDGRLGEISENLANFDKFDELENKIKLTLRNENPKIEIAFYLYLLSNNPPIREMQNFEDPSIRNKQIGMMLINNIKYKNMGGHSGPLEFILQQAFHSTAEYWQTNSIAYSSLPKPQPGWKHPIALSLVARPDKLSIHFKHGTKGRAEVKISIGPAGEMEFIWPKLMRGGPVNVGEHSLMEKGFEELMITFDLSCHSIVTSRHIFEKGKVQRSPLSSVLSHKSTIKQNADVTPTSPGIQHIPSFKNKPPSDQNINRTQGLSIAQKHSSYSSQEYSFYNIPSDNVRTHVWDMDQNRRSFSMSSQETTLGNQPKQYQQHTETIISKGTNNQTQSFQSHERSYSLVSSGTSKSKTRNDINNPSRQYRESYNGGYTINQPQIYEEFSPIEQDSTTTSQTSSSKSKKTRSLSIPSKYLNIIPENIEQHVKLGCSPPSYTESKYYDPTGSNDYGLYQNPPTPPTPPTHQRRTSLNYSTYSSSSNTCSFHNDNYDNSHLLPHLYNQFEITSRLQKATYNEVYLGRHVRTADKVIIKLYKSYSRWENETYFLRSLKSKMIVKLEDISVNPTKEQECFIITRYFGKSLDEISEDIYDNKTDIKNVFLSTCKAIEWCHSKGVVHMDLNPSNIICKDQKIFKIRLCDFEHSRKEGDYIFSNTYTRPFPLGFMPPELFFLKQQQNVSSSPTSHSSSSSPSSTSSQSRSLLVQSTIDIFSLGCIFYYLNTANLLYNSEKELEQLNLTKICEDIEDEQVSILVQWMVGDNERPDITQILENSFFD